MSISNVLLVESLNFNLLSVAQLCDLEFKCIFGVDDVEIISVNGCNLIFKSFRYENLNLVDFNASEAQLSTCLFTKSSMCWLWHRRLGHVGMKQLNRLVKHDLEASKMSHLRRISYVVHVKPKSKLVTHILRRA